MSERGGIRGNLIVGIAFALYIWLLFWVVILKYNNARVLSDGYDMLKNGVSNAYWGPPYKELIPAIQNGNKDWYILESVLNILLFVPLGMHVNKIFKCNLLQYVFIFLLPMAIEFSQTITYIGGLQLEDMVGNIVGLLLGLWIFKLFRIDKKEYFWVQLHLLSLIVLVPLSLYSIINTILHIELYEWVWQHLIGLVCGS